MLPVRVLVVGNSRILLRRLRLALEGEGYMVSLARGNGTPAVVLARSEPDLVIAQIRPDRATIEAWRRAIEAFRAHRSLSVLALMTGASSEEERKTLEEMADLGIVQRPLRKRVVLGRLEEWYASEAPLLRAS